MSVKISSRTNKPVRKYVKKNFSEATKRKAKCGHFSSEGRYFKCENCQPELPDDNGDWNYFGDESDSNGDDCYE